MPEPEQQGLLEKVPQEFREALGKELDASGIVLDWIAQLSDNQAWVLGYSEADAWEELARRMHHRYVPTRQEVSPSKGEELLEIAQRIHTGADALATGELKWGTGKERIKDVMSDSKPAIMRAIRVADERLINVLINTPPTAKITQKMPDGSSKELSPVDIITGITEHTVGHFDMLRVLLDGTMDLFPASYKRTMPQTPVVKPS